MSVNLLPPRKPPTRDRREERPHMDADRVALAVQKKMGRPVTWAEYVKIVNATETANGTNNFLSGEQVSVPVWMPK